MSIPMLLNLGLSGFAFCGTDVGGFGFDCTGELLARWVQVGCFTPLFRNHTAIETRDQEPWTFDAQILDINRKYIHLRYQLLPYFYDRMWESENRGFPVLRTLVFHYPHDEKTHEINDQFLVGENILIAPILQQGQIFRAVYLPQGNWVDYWTKETFPGKVIIIKEADLETCPIYIKAGSIIPNYPLQNYVGEKKIAELTLDIYPDSGQYLHYQDDGASFAYRQGEYNLYEFKMSTQEHFSLNIDIKHAGYNQSYQSFKIQLNRIEAKTVYFNNTPIDFQITDHHTEFSTPVANGTITVIA